MLRGDGSFEPDWRKWSGFFPDMIARLAPLANFNYTLHSATGEGSSCGSGGDPRDHMSAYNCAQDDVSELNATDVYWAMYVAAAPDWSQARPHSLSETRGCA